jgi:hypothetical protein
VELQADEIRTILGCKKQPIWVFAVIDVWSRLWRTVQELDVIEITGRDKASPSA